jgi:predicted permease
MNPFVNAFLNVLTPIFIVAGLGYLAVRVGLLTDSRALSRVALYIFIPALTFSSLVKSKLPAEEFFILFFFAWIIAAAQGLFGWLIARGFSFDRLTQSAFLISIITLNAGNYGLPLNQFAYGAEGLTRATAYFIASSIVTQSLGVFIASRGTRNLRASVGQVFKMPLVYAALTGLIVNRTGVVVPDLIFRPLDLMAQAADDAHAAGRRTGAGADHSRPDRPEPGGRHETACRAADGVRACCAAGLARFDAQRRHRRIVHADGSDGRAHRSRV